MAFNGTADAGLLGPDAHKLRTIASNDSIGAPAADVDGQHVGERPRSRSRSVSDPPQLHRISPLSPKGEDIKLQSQIRLEKELSRVKEELKLKDEEVEKLSRVRDQVVEELDELTSSLFQEAYGMVDKAKEEKATAEKKLKESCNKMEVLEAEVTALKMIIRPSRPPQISAGPSSPSAPSHRRTASSPAAPDSSLLLFNHSRRRLSDPSSLNPVDFNEFSHWLKSPSLDADNSFMSTCHEDDIRPCMKFPNQEFADRVLKAVQDNTICIEAVLGNKDGTIDAPSYCALFGSMPKPCGYRIKLSDSSNWQFISRRARNRITSVCDLYVYLRYIQQGIVKVNAATMFQEVMHLRAEITLSRLGMSATTNAPQ
eukprot:m.22228 g.22228  ORF g.22228 m.22228 type:complete len:370 (+) comp28310_c0_seq1:301-1410(+)